MLNKVGETWQFESEYELEELLWHNLAKLLNLQPLKRQFAVRGQFCDILEIASDLQLVVIELKDVEDRYVVQQLTRYYNALFKEQPFRDEVDWEKPIRLLAIRPRHLLQLHLQIALQTGQRCMAADLLNHPQRHPRIREIRQARPPKTVGACPRNADEIAMGRKRFSLNCLFNYSIKRLISLIFSLNLV